MTIDIAEVLAFAGARLADFKVPQYVVRHRGAAASQRRRQGRQAALRQAIDWGAARR